MSKAKCQYLKKTHTLLLNLTGAFSYLSFGGIGFKKGQKGSRALSVERGGAGGKPAGWVAGAPSGGKGTWRVARLLQAAFGGARGGLEERHIGGLRAPAYRGGTLINYNPFLPTARSNDQLCMNLGICWRSADREGPASCFTERSFLGSRGAGCFVYSPHLHLPSSTSNRNRGPCGGPARWPSGVSHSPYRQAISPERLARSVKGVRGRPIRTASGAQAAFKAELGYGFLPPPLSGGIGSRQQKQRLRAPYVLTWISKFPSLVRVMRNMH